MTELILIRHGETDWNRELRFQGHVDVGLNAIGLEQARRLAARLSGEVPAGLYCSDLLRARQTARPIGAEVGRQEVADSELREQCFGILDGMSVDDIQQQHPDLWAGWLRFDADYCVPQGESTRQFHARVMRGLHRLAADHAGGLLVVVTHGGVLDMVYRTARSLGLGGPRESDIPNAGLNRVRLHDGRVEILAWADVQHLADLPPQPVYDQKKYVTASSPSAG